MLQNLDEQINVIKNYLKKITRVIDMDAMFSVGKFKIINKARIDDILCCIEASFPEEYKQSIKKGMAKHLKSYILYNEMSNAVKKPFFLSSSCYIIKHSDVKQMIHTILSTIESDIKKVYSDAQDMY